MQGYHLANRLYRTRGLIERKDDWQTSTIWYEPVPSEQLPTLPNMKERVTDLIELFPIIEIIESRRD